MAGCLRIFGRSIPPSTLVKPNLTWLSAQVSFHPSRDLPRQTGRTGSVWALALSTRAATNKKLQTQSGPATKTAVRCSIQTRMHQPVCVCVCKIDATQTTEKLQVSTFRGFVCWLLQLLISWSCPCLFIALSPVMAAQSGQRARRGWDGRLHRASISSLRCSSTERTSKPKDVTVAQGRLCVALQCASHTHSSVFKLCSALRK